VSDVDAHVERFRDVRRRLEAGILPLATSVDGRRFSFQASLHGLELRAGGYVALDDGGTIRLGQVLDLHLEHADGPELGAELGDGDAAFDARSRVVLRVARGEGVVLDGEPGSFHDARVRPAAAAEVESWLERTRPPRAILPVGELALVPGAPLAVDAGGFDRHTFLCGQSGSGKTYALGVLLEQLLLATGLRIVVLDPNSDFVRLPDLRVGTEHPLAEDYRAATGGVVVRRAGEGGGERLRLRFAELDAATQAAVLRLDPVADAAEYAELVAFVEASRAAGTLVAPERVADWLEGEARPLGVRTRNLGVDRWGSGRARTRARCSTSSAREDRAVSWWTSARSRRARSRRSPPRPSWRGSGSDAPTASRCCS
jgi:hypothetical protein